MPNTKSAKKTMRTSEARRVKNKATRTALKNLSKKVFDAVTAGDVAKAEADYRSAASKLDRAATKGVIHKNAAARRKSQLQTAIKAAKKK